MPPGRGRTRALTPLVCLWAASGLGFRSPQAPPAGPAAPPRSARAAPPILEGTVKGAGGRPIARAMVLAQSTTGPEDALPLTTRTDDQGAFRLPLADSAPHTVRIDARGWAGRTLHRIRPGPKLEVTLAEGLTVEGIVRDGVTGRPLAGARVEAGEEGALLLPWDDGAGLGVPPTTTETDGRFRLDGIGTGTQTVTASAKGYGRATQRAALAGRRVELLLFPGSSIAGTVIGPDGRGVAGAVVRAEAEFSPPPRGLRTAVSDRAGRFEVLGVERGSYRLVARHPEFAPGTVAGVSIEARSTAHADLVLTHGSALVGRLLNGAGLPVKGRVGIQELDGQPTTRSLVDLLHAEAAEDGRFRIGRVPPGSHALAILAPGFAPKRLEVEVGPRDAETSVGHVVLDVGLAIRGHVRDAAGQSVPFPRIGVLLFRPGSGVLRLSEERGEPDGSFAVAGLHPGRYQLTVRAAGFGDATRTADAGTDNLEIVVEPAGTVTGVVVDERDRPVGDARVTSRAARREGILIGRWWTRQTAVEPDGRFTLEDLGEGTWTLEVAATDHVKADVAPVKVVPGANVDVGRIRLGAGGTVRGIVVDAFESPVAGATVTVGPPGVAQATSDGRGRFELRGVAAGVVDLVASHPAHADERVLNVSVDPPNGPTETRIVLSAGGRVEGWARRRDGRGIPGATVQVTSSWTVMERGREAVTAMDGSFAVDNLPVGVARVTVRAPGGSGSTQTRQVHVAEGETSTVEFISREILVTGRVVRRGDPAPGLHVWLHRGTGTQIVAVGPREVPAAPVGPERQRAVTRDDGGFALIVDEPGEYVARVESLDGRISYPARKVEIPDAEGYRLDLLLATASVAGVVVDADTDQPVPDATVTAQPTEPAAAGVGRASSTSGPDGRFLLELEPGRYRLAGIAEGYARAETASAVDAVTAGEVRLVLPRARSLSGRVTDPVGRGIGRVYVSATARGSSRPQPRTAWTLADGSFTFPRLPPGAYDVYAWSELGFALRAGVAGAEDLALSLRPGSQARVTVLAPEGTPEESASLSIVRVGDVVVTDLQLPGATDGEGQVELTLPPGVIDVRAAARGLEGRTRVSVPENGSVAVEIRLAAPPARTP